MLRRMLIAATLFALAAPGVANAQNPVLRGTVGPGHTITLTRADGSRLGVVTPGTYDVVVEDRSDEHNFHLTGPGVNQATTVEGAGTVTWTVTLANGTYTFRCDAHSTTMRAQFQVGAGSNAPPPSPPSGGHTTHRGTLVATVGPRATIRLTRRGARVRSLRPGRYTIRVNDRSRMHSFHLRGPGLNRKTGVGHRGRTTWTVTLRRGTHRFYCDAHARTMKGIFRVR